MGTQSGRPAILPRIVRRSDTTDACHSQGRKEPTRGLSKPAHVRQPRTTVVTPVLGSWLDRNEEQDSGLCRSLVERDKEEDGFVHLGWEETREGGTVGGTRLTIEIGSLSRFSRTLDDCGPSLAPQERENPGKRRPRSGLAGPDHRDCGRTSFHDRYTNSRSADSSAGSWGTTLALEGTREDRLPRTVCAAFRVVAMADSSSSDSYKPVPHRLAE